MAARAVQISLDEDLLKRVDADPDVRRMGRSAFIREAVERQLALKARREVDARIRKAFRGQADAMAAEIEDLMGTQAWPGK